jgi:F-box-like
LLAIIISYLGEPRDLNCLSLTCRRFNIIAEPALYNRISTTLSHDISDPRFLTLSESPQVKLYQTLKTRRLAVLVTDFRVQISVCNWVTPWYKRKCRCEKFESALVQALASLENLQTFHFICTGDLSFKKARHSYLEALKTKCLRQVIYYCSCEFNMFDPYRLLASACMRSITSLSIINRAIDGVNCATDNSVATKYFLPNIQKLCCFDIGVLDLLFAKGTVTHL